MSGFGDSRARLLLRVPADRLPSRPESGSRGEEKWGEDKRWAAEVRERLGLPTSASVTPTYDPRGLEALVRRAKARDPRYTPPPLSDYLHVEIPEGGTNQAAQILPSDLPTWQSASGEIALAAPWPPDTDDAPDSHGLQQGYLAPSPVGIGAQLVWALPGGGGMGAAFVDVEGGWHLAHPDLMLPGAHVLAAPGAPLPQEKHVKHGTYTLGVVLARNNGTGLIGVAHGVEDDGVWLLRQPSLDTLVGSGVADDVLTLLFGGESPAPPEGAVILLEMQWQPASTQGFFDETGQAVGYLPMEARQDWAELISLLVSAGFVVIEAAGNAHHDLSRIHAPREGLADAVTVLDPDSPEGFDSGAVIVGAAYPQAPDPIPPGLSVEFLPERARQRVDQTNYGRRVDCFAWGHQVYSAKLHWTPVVLGEHAYTHTSAASAIVAGAALSLQGMVKALRGVPLEPLLVRKALSELGTPSLDADGNPEVDRIGRMPDLALIAETVLSHTILRDHAQDTGEGPGADWMESPDLEELGEDGLPSPRTTVFGTNRTGLLRVRVHNRGFAAAADVSAWVFWHPAATLPIPGLFQPVATTSFAALPPGGEGASELPFTPPAGAPGHVTWTAILHHVWDRAPGTTHLGASLDSAPAELRGQLAAWDAMAFRARTRGDHKVGVRNVFAVEPTSVAIPEDPWVTHSFDLLVPLQDNELGAPNGTLVVTPGLTANAAVTVVHLPVLSEPLALWVPAALLTTKAFPVASPPGDGKTTLPLPKQKGRLLALRFTVTAPHAEAAESPSFVVEHFLGAERVGRARFELRAAK